VAETTSVTATGTPATGTFRRGLAAIFGPLWVSTFRDPVREGRLRLDGLSGPTRQLARIGLVALAVLLASTLFAAAWRRGDLIPIDSGGSHDFIPPGVFAMTLVGLFLAWALMTWGALSGSASVRLAGAAGYLLVNTNFGISGNLDIDSGRWVLAHSKVLLEVGLYAPVAALVVAALSARRPRIDRAVVVVARVVCVLGSAALFLVLLWIQHAENAAGQQSVIPSVVGSSMFDLHFVLLPLLYVAAVAVIDFALDVSSSLATPAGRLQRRWVALVLVLALAAVKLWFEVGTRLDYWRSTLVAQSPATIRTVLCVGGLVVVVAAVTRFRRSDDTLAAKEDLIQGGALVVALPWLIQIGLLSAGVWVANTFDSVRLAGWAADFPSVWLSTWGLLAVAVVAVAVGIWLMRRSEGGLGDEVGSGLVVVGAWDAVALALSGSGLALGFSYSAIDVLVTLGALGVLLVRWRHADVRFLVMIGTVLGFSWLVTSRGDYLSFIGGLVGLSTGLVLVFGIVWTLLSGSSYASASSRRLPATARTPLYLGYLLLSVALVHWDEVSHTFTGGDSDGLVGYYFLGIPLAAWLLGRHVVRRRDDSAGGEPGALPEEVGDGVGATEL
jgi:hypothetical protein